MSKDKIRVGLLGLGVVGSGTYKILQDNGAIIKNQAGVEVVVEKVLVNDISKQRAVDVPHDMLTTNPEDIINNSDIDLVVEVMGGENPAFDYINKAIKNGKYVVTANKELIAKKGNSILKQADEKGVSIGFEASVCGGIPIIRALKSSLCANKIKKIMGIVNGTTNYILTKMSVDGMDYKEALSEAQGKGYAESNPKADVEGYDAMYKMAILSSIGFISRVDINNIVREGITGVTKADIQYAKELGCTVKLLGIAEEIDGKVDVSVSPTMLPIEHPLASVNYVNNAVLVDGDAVGEIMFYGAGAGQMPTGSSVVSDIIEAARNINNGTYNRRNCTCFESKESVDVNDAEASYYLRLDVMNKPGVLGSIASTFGTNEVSLESVIQKKTEANNAEIVWITSKVKKQQLNKALHDIGSLHSVNEICSVIRFEADNR